MNAHEAEEARDALEAKLARPISLLVDEFAKQVIAMAGDAFGKDDDDVLLAGLRSPFTLGSVINEWTSGVEKAVGVAQRVLPVNLATPEMLQSLRKHLLSCDFPSRLFDGAKNVLLDAAREGWTRATTLAKITEIVREQSPEATAGIVRTEATRLYNHTALTTLAQRGYAMKEWVAVMDDRTRSSHAEAHGQKVPLDQPFIVGGWSMMYPGDSTAPPEEVYNCRCVLIESGENPIEALYEVPE